jgi:riboflavin kinase/FMN adenylyltransferase
LDPFSLSGKVIHGNHMGRSLGYPTANLNLVMDPGLSAKRGVYAVKVRYSRKTFGGMANIGYRPTIRENGFTVEVHLFGFSGDLYGKLLEVDFLERIRVVVKFGSLEDLTRQMQHDETAAREILSGLLKTDPDTV